jgi:hypothetical protein
VNDLIEKATGDEEHTVAEALPASNLWMLPALCYHLVMGGLPLTSGQLFDDRAGQLVPGPANNSFGRVLRTQVSLLRRSSLRISFTPPTNIAYLTRCATPDH